MKTQIYNFNEYTVLQIPVWADNYIYLVGHVTNQWVAIDPAEAQPVLDILKGNNGCLRAVVNTHHHFDHVGGNQLLAKETGCEVIGPKKDHHRIPMMTKGVGCSDSLALLGLQWHVLDVPGHTSGHIAFHLPQIEVLFCGDTLFACGCGRLFEGTPPQMWRSLLKIRNLSDMTTVFCTHEYTFDNLRFCLTLEKDSQPLQNRLESVRSLREKDLPSVPFSLAEEKQMNPFLRCDDPNFAKTVGKQGCDPEEIFAYIRGKKDQFS